MSLAKMLAKMGRGAEEGLVPMAQAGAGGAGKITGLGDKGKMALAGLGGAGAGVAGDEMLEDDDDPIDKLLKAIGLG